MKFVAVLLFALVVSTFAHNGHKVHKVVQLSSEPSIKGPLTYNAIPISIWSDGSVIFTVSPANAQNSLDFAETDRAARQVLTGKVDLDNLADLLMHAVDNEYTKLENSYSDKNEKPSDSAVCLTINDKHGATKSCELNANAAPQVFQDLVCKVRALIASAEDVKPFVPESAFIRAYSISKKGVAIASIWEGKQLLVDSQKGVWFHKKDAAMAFEAAVKGTVFDYQGQYVELTAQVHGVSLVDPMNKEDQVEANNAASIANLHIAMIVMMALVAAFVIAAGVFFAVSCCGKLIKAYESDEHLCDEEQGHSDREDDSDEEERPEEETPFLSVHTDEPLVEQQQTVAEPTQYFYVIPQNQVVFPTGAEHYVMPNNFGPFPHVMNFNSHEQQQ
jgi:hypothetical protein